MLMLIQGEQVTLASQQGIPVGVQSAKVVTQLVRHVCDGKELDAAAIAKAFEAE